LANTFLLTTRGVPQLYYGDEIGMEGEDEPTTRGDFPGGFPGDKRNAFTRAGRSSEQQRLFEHIQRLTKWRREFEALRTGKLINLYVSEQQYAYMRVTPGKGSVVVVLNNDNKPVDLEIDLRPHLRASGSLVDQISIGRSFGLSDGKLYVRAGQRSASIAIFGPPTRAKENPYE
jgi:glycosidase